MDTGEYEPRYDRECGEDGHNVHPGNDEVGTPQINTNCRVNFIKPPT